MLMTTLKLQIQQIDELIRGGIDLLIVSPNESASTTPIELYLE